VSLQARLGFYTIALKLILVDPLGQGYGATGAATLLSDAGQGWPFFDSGILDVLRTLGWLGGAELFLGGTLAIMYQLTHRGMSRNDNFAHAGRAIVIAVFACMLSLNTMAGLIGALFWGFVGLVLAAQRYAEATGESGGNRGLQSGQVSFSTSGHA
jgi:hypothetical protein